MERLSVKQRRKIAKKANYAKLTPSQKKWRTFIIVMIVFTALCGCAWFYVRLTQPYVGEDGNKLLHFIQEYPYIGLLFFSFCFALLHILVDKYSFSVSDKWIFLDLSFMPLSIAFLLIAFVSALWWLIFFVLAGAAFIPEILKEKKY